MFSEQQEKWLKRVEDLFLRFGIKSITMDDVARELGMSKKTLYQFVESKDELVMKVLQRHLEGERKECIEICHQTSNAIEEMLCVIESNTEQVTQMRSNILHDLQKYYHDAWQLLRDFQRGFMYQVVRDNLVRGVNEGLYRQDFDIDIIAKIHILSAFSLFDESLFASATYPREKVFQQYLEHYLHGILSEKGRQWLNENTPIPGQ